LLEEIKTGRFSLTLLWHSSCCPKCYRTHLERGITSRIKEYYWQL